MSRKGFTLVELLAVLAIVGLLFALLLPVLQAAREAAHRSECSSNLRQIGMALQSYESSARTFPAGYLSRFQPDGTETGPGWGWAALLLEYLEAGSTHARLRFDHPIEDPLNGEPRTQRIASYLCPAESIEPAWPTFAAYGDVGPHPDSKICEVASAHYVAMFGNAETGAAGHGLFFRNSQVRLRDITDGTTTTIAAGERSRQLGRATWVGSVTGAYLGPDVDEFPQPPDAEWWLEPAAAMVLGRAGEQKGPGDPHGTRDMFFSQHAHGVNFVFADAHVAFLSNDVDPRVFEALSTRAGGETISEPF